MCHSNADRELWQKERETIWMRSKCFVFFSFILSHQFGDNTNNAISFNGAERPSNWMHLLKGFDRRKINFPQINLPLTKWMKKEWMGGKKRESTCCAFNKFLSQTRFIAVSLRCCWWNFSTISWQGGAKKKRSVRRRTQPRSLPFINDVARAHVRYAQYWSTRWKNFRQNN